jgi:hypothetical protein
VKKIIITIIFVLMILQCVPRTVVQIESPSSRIGPEMFLKPVAPIAGYGYVVDTVGNGEIDWGTGIIHAKGTGVIDPNNPNEAQARLMAQRAAIIVAQRNLLETAKGVRVTSETVVENYMAKSDLIYTRVDGVVKGAKLIGEPRYDKEQGIVEVELMISLYDKKGLSDAIIPPVITPDTYKDLTPETKTLLQKYSGIIFDASGTGLKPSMFPKIYDENGDLIIDTGAYIDTTSGYGRKVIQYIGNLDKILENPDLKDNPLIIKVKDIRGKLESDIIISKENSERFKWLKDAFQFLLVAGRTFIKIL